MKDQILICLVTFACYLIPLMCYVSGKEKRAHRKRILAINKNYYSEMINLTIERKYWEQKKGNLRKRIIGCFGRLENKPNEFHVLEPEPQSA